MPSIELLKKFAARLKAPLNNVIAIDEVESGGESFWNIAGEILPAVRFEAHWFSAKSHPPHKFDAIRPDLSSPVWNPALAAKTQAGAWAQVRGAEQLDHVAAREATSYGRFQVMGFNWSGLRYPSVDAFVDSMSTEEGQFEAFARYIEADPILQRALQVGNWPEIEQRYNGGGYGGAYARKLATAAGRLAGPVDQLAIQNGMSPVRPLRRGDKGDDVARLQLALGIKPVDGDFGPATDAALRAFQGANGLIVDGVAGRMTKAELGLVK